MSPTLPFTNALPVIIPPTVPNIGSYSFDAPRLSAGEGRSAAESTNPASHDYVLNVSPLECVPMDVSQTGDSQLSTADHSTMSPVYPAQYTADHSTMSPVYPAQYTDDELILWTDDAKPAKSTRVQRRYCYWCYRNDSKKWRRSVLAVGKIACSPCGSYERAYGQPRPHSLEINRMRVRDGLNDCMWSCVDTPWEASVEGLMAVYPTPAPHTPAPPIPAPLHTEIEYTDDANVRSSERVHRQCFNCRRTDTTSWRRSKLTIGKAVCKACGEYEDRHERARPMALEVCRIDREAEWQKGMTWFRSSLGQLEYGPCV